MINRKLILVIVGTETDLAENRLPTNFRVLSLFFFPNYKNGKTNFKNYLSPTESNTLPEIKYDDSSKPSTQNLSIIMFTDTKKKKYIITAYIFRFI